MKKVCTVGSATQDIFMIYEGADTLHLRKKGSSSSYLLLPQGAKIDIPKLHYALGGGAVNLAVGLTELGHRVEPFFKTGNDSPGKLIREELSKQTIATTYCPFDDHHKTAVSVIIPSLEQDHAALCYRGANRYLMKHEFPLPILEELDLLFIGPLGGASQELLTYLASQAKKASVPIALNPSLQQIKDHTLISTLDSVDILIMNTRESGYLMHTLIQAQGAPQFALNHASPALLNPYLTYSEQSFTLTQVFAQILTRGPKIIVVTNGAEGVYVATKEQIYFHPSIPVEHSYSLGAGDGFSSAFIGAYLHGLPLIEAVRYGCINGSSVAQYPDAHQGLLSLKELEHRAKMVSSDLLKSYAL